MTQLLKCLIPTIGAPETLNGNEGRYELAAFYGELLAMKIVNEDWLLIAPNPPAKFFIALDGDGWDDRRPPRWPDPEYPQQQHLDILVPDVDATGVVATANGASLLQDSGPFRVYADPAGHPFCLYADDFVDRPVVGRLVFDCCSPRALAGFYENFLGGRRIEDSAERVVVDLQDETLPDLAFQQAQFRAARWPDPDYPAQLHVDYRWHDAVTARAALERAVTNGAIELRPNAGVYADPASHPFCIQNETPLVFDIVGLYLDPPEYAVVYGVDQSTQGQASEDTQSTGSTTDPAVVRVHNNIDSALAPLLTTVEASVRPPPGSAGRAAAFRQFLAQIYLASPSGLELNLVCDWAGTYENTTVQDWLAEHANVQVHRNAPESSWDEQMPRWIDYYAAELSRRGDDTTAPALEASIRSWAQAESDTREPFVWSKSTHEIVESLQRCSAHLGLPAN